MAFLKPETEKIFIKIPLVSPSGGGKKYGSLEFAKNIKNERRINMITSKTLKGMAEEIMGLTQADGVRMYFDDENELCVYDSAKIFNFFCCCEEVAYYIYKGEYKEAEKLIDGYVL